MTDTPPAPIMVNATPGLDQVATGIRYALMAGSSIATALGAAGVAGRFDALLTAAGPVAMAVVFLWGQYSARTKSKALAVIAESAPNKVAQVKT